MTKEHPQKDKEPLPLPQSSEAVGVVEQNGSTYKVIFYDGYIGEGKLLANGTKLFTQPSPNIDELVGSIENALYEGFMLPTTRIYLIKEALDKYRGNHD